MQDNIWVTSLSIVVNLVQFLVLLFTGISASSGKHSLKFTPHELNSASLIFFVIPVLCLFLSIKLVSAFDQFLRKEILIKQLIYTDKTCDLWSYFISYILFKEFIYYQGNDLILRRIVIIREVVIIAVVVYSTITVTLIQSKAINVITNFFGVLFVLDFDQYLYDLSFSDFKPQTVRRQYPVDSENFEEFNQDFRNAKIRFEIAYTLQLFLIIYLCILYMLFGVSLDKTWW